jgi:preprotein translocase subunit SecF
VADHKPFRYLIPPGSQFDFLRTRWINIISVLLLAASVAALLVNYAVRGAPLNWTIDFQGGTEIVISARDTQTGTQRALELGAVRNTLEAAGFPEVEVSTLAWSAGNRDIEGLVVRTTRFGAVGPERAADIERAIEERFADRGAASRWSGDVLHVRATRPISESEIVPILTAAGLELAPGARAGGGTEPDAATGEYRLELAVAGLDRELARVLERAFPNTEIEVVQSYAVGPRASEDLFVRGLRAIVYAMALIMLYLAFRFDIRYAPGAIKATIHDAVIVVGVLAATWTPVSLATLAALLTVIGYSVNDTAIVFDRIRENLRIYKAETLERVVNMSLNQVLGRSLLTSLFVFAVTLAMYIFGDGVLAGFAFVLCVGVVVSAVSTIFLSAPVFVWISKRWYSRPPRERHYVSPPSRRLLGKLGR